MDSEDLITGCLNGFCGFSFQKFLFCLKCFLFLSSAFKAPVPRLQEQIRSAALHNHKTDA